MRLSHLSALVNNDIYRVRSLPSHPYWSFSPDNVKWRSIGGLINVSNSNPWSGRRMEVVKAIFVSVLWCSLCTLPATVTSVMPAAFAHIPSWTLWVQLMYSCTFAGTPVKSKIFNFPKIFFVVSRHSWNMKHRNKRKTKHNSSMGFYYIDRFRK